MHAHETGLVDAFFYDETSGEDGLLHVLSGEMVAGPDGASLPMGFHHEPSAIDSRTFVDRQHLELEVSSSDHRRRYREFPYEPYPAHVVIEGLRKVRVATADDGTKEIAPAKSHMFPKEYDPLAVMKTVVAARDNRDTSTDVLDPENQVIVARGSAIVLDGQTKMDIGLILEPASGKIRSAFPANRKESGLMALDKEQVLGHLGLQ
ncbi:MAG: hypothetical protein V4702_05470 [Patescibacteria group bacterium]